MIFEKIDLHFDVERLRQQLVESIFPLLPHMESESFGGWSVLSSNGSYRDGWKGAEAFKKDFMPGATIDEKLAAVGAKRSSAYIHNTEICQGYLAEVIDTIRAAGLTPMRARISMLKANGKSTIHRDAADHEYAVRLHVPIVTNEKCFFKTEEGSVHLPASGDAFLLRVNRWHQVTNESDSDRVHLIMSVVDRNGFSKLHRFASTSL